MEKRNTAKEKKKENKKYPYKKINRNNKEGCGIILVFRGGRTRYCGDIVMGKKRYCDYCSQKLNKTKEVKNEI